MKHNYKHIDLNNNAGMPEGFFQGVEIPYEKNREEVWASLEERMSVKPSLRTMDFRFQRLMYAIAAVILLLAGIFSIMRYYTTSVYCPGGEHLSYQLPDGSKIELNADSKLSYKSLWWQFSREVRFEGEGYFEVEKGKKFSVISAAGRTEVLGTSFNIYSRENEYKVTCLTGKVRVVSFAEEEAVLGPEYTAQVNSQGEIVVSKETQASESHAWVSNMFSFTSRPLALVFKEIERQYDIAITCEIPVDYLYTGYFTKNRSVEETLTLVCTPFGLTFARISEKKFEISQN